MRRHGTFMELQIQDPVRFKPDLEFLDQLAWEEFGVNMSHWCEAANPVSLPQLYKDCHDEDDNPCGVLLLTPKQYRLLESLSKTVIIHREETDGAEVHLYTKDNVYILVTKGESWLKKKIREKLEDLFWFD